MVDQQNIGTIAILRECKNQWERRCSLTPNEVKVLVEQGVKVLVQPSTVRCYSEDEFEEVGAKIQEDVAEATVIFGVKEVPIENLIPNKTYFFFSHTIKAQDYNMPLLDKLLEKNIRMVDFERICDAGPNPQRLVAFGRYAGIAGAFDFLRGVGEFLLKKNFQTPFVFLGSSYMYEDYEAMCEALKRVHKNILKGGIPKAKAPMVFAVTGTGRVAQGILEVLEQLPHEKVDPDDLATYDKVLNKQVVISVFQHKHMVRHKDGKEFDKKDYYANSQNYVSKFHEYLPYISWLVQGIYWEPKYPRTLTTNDLKEAIENGNNKLMGLSDISADYEGSIEFTRRFTNIEKPFLCYNAVEDSFKEEINDCEENDIMFTSVDHLPAEMPKEASNHFGEKLLPFVIDVLKSDFSKPFAEQDDLPREIYNACITTHGKLNPQYTYIAEMREINEREKAQKEEYKQTVDELALEHQNSGNKGGLKRSQSLLTIVLSGHLFDTRCFNSCLDICEHNGVQFRVVDLEVGNTGDQNTCATLQLAHRNPNALNSTLDLIVEETQKHQVQLNHGSGPSADTNILQSMTE